MKSFVFALIKYKRLAVNSFKNINYNISWSRLLFASQNRTELFNISKLFYCFVLIKSRFIRSHWLLKTACEMSFPTSAYSINTAEGTV